MKKRFNAIKITKYDKFPQNKKLKFPFNKKLLDLLKKENKFKQEYYYVEKDNDYAFIIVYKMKLNLFTFGKLNLNIKTSVIGYPCSLSEEGFIPNPTLC